MKKRGYKVELKLTNPEGGLLGGHFIIFREEDKAQDLYDSALEVLLKAKLMMLAEEDK